MKFKTPPYDYQRRALRFIIDHRGGGLLMEPGTGKTKVAIDYCSYLAQKTDRLQRVLVVGPLGVLGVWEDELEKHFFGEYHVVRYARRGKKRKAAVEELAEAHSHAPVFFLINYESCWRLFDQITRWRPQVVIADESHRIKNTGARQSKALHKFSRMEPTPLRLILTGTAITNSPLDVYSQWKFLNRERFEAKWWDFKYHYAVWGGYGGYELLGYRDLEILAQHVRQDAFIATKEECLDLPPAVDSIIRVGMSSKADKAYTQMSHDLIAFIDGADQPVTAAIILTKLLRLSQISGGFTKTDDGQFLQLGSEKLDALAEIIDSLQGRKVVIFCRFLWELQAIADLTTRLERTIGRISGGEPIEKRDRSIRSFQRGKVDTLICQIATGGLGIDLSAAHYGIFYSLDYSSDHYIQARDRLHRHGQEHKVTYYHLITKSTIDRMVLRCLRGHQKIADMVLNDPRLLVGRQEDAA